MMDSTLDYRLPENRELGFDKFYQFMCATEDVSPDLAVEKWIANHQGFDFEKRAVMALFHGATYAGPCETMFSDKFPIMDESSVKGMIEFFNTNKKRLLFSPDCKYRKIVFPKFLESVAKSIKPYGTLGKFIRSHYDHNLNTHEMYLRLQKSVFDQWYACGRMFFWCFAEALQRFMDAPIQPPSMEFGPGGDSHTSGWAFCVSRDDLVEKIGDGKTLNQMEIAGLQGSADTYLANFKSNHQATRHANYFTLETACCNYKRQHKGSRYGGCYIDEQHTEITQMRKDWPEYDWLWDLYMEGRKAVMPHSVLFEMNAHDTNEAYIKSWNNCLKDYGRIPRVEAWHNKTPQLWRELKHMPFAVEDTLDAWLQ